MLRARDFRYHAWQQLNGKWGTMALATLLMELIMGLCGGLSYIAIGAIAAIIVAGPLSIGYAILSMQVIRGAEIKVDTLFSGFRMFERSFVLYLLNAIFTALWSLLFIIPGIIKALSYSMSPFILVDNPNMSPNDARKLSMQMMEGNKWRLFCLELSFIGWYILVALTFGILSFWVTPYEQTAVASFYQSLIADNQQFNQHDNQQYYGQPPYDGYAQQPDNGGYGEPRQDDGYGVPPEDPFEQDSNKF